MRNGTHSAAAPVETYQPSPIHPMDHHPTFTERERALTFIAETLPALAARLTEFAAVIRRESEYMQAAQLRFAKRQQHRPPTRPSRR